MMKAMRSLKFQKIKTDAISVFIYPSEYLPASAGVVCLI